jgi:hypothetical protein
MDVPIPIQINASSFTETAARTDFFSAANVLGKRHNFYAGNDGTIPLAYQTLTWDTENENAIFFVKIPLLTANDAENNVLLIAYSDSLENNWPIVNQDNPRDVWGNNFVSAFHFNDDSFVDSVTTQDLTNVGTTSAETRMDTGRAFDGTAGIYADHNDAYIFDSQGSISLLFKHPSTNSVRTLVDKWNESADGDDTGATTGGYRLSLNADGKLVFEISDGTTTLTKTGTTSIDDNAEHHVAAVYSACVLRLYVDGVED